MARRETLPLVGLLLLLVIAGALFVARPHARGTLPHVQAALRIDVNTARASTLTLLPRIGPALARRIVRDREAHGPFHSLADLDRVPGIGPKTLERLAASATCVFPPTQTQAAP